MNAKNKKKIFVDPVARGRAEQSESGGYPKQKHNAEGRNPARARAEQGVVPVPR